MMYRTHQTSMLNLTEVGKEVVVSGWINKRRDFGSLIFIDVRDRSGIVQVVVDQTTDPLTFQQAEKLRNEFVVAIKGVVTKRAKEAVNPNLLTGEIEIKATVIEILNEAKNPPFYIQDNIEVDETVRLKYRYLDLRRPEMFKTFQLRHKITTVIRNFLDQNGFIDVETPILTKSTPEGARDFLVPSRLNPGEFFALPQSPQLFKQLLMVAGFERYFQVTRCFRDEDLRADRQPEFTQVDIETSFLPLADFHKLMEEMMAKVVKETKGIDIPLPFPRITYHEAMERFGSDKPDIRFAMELVDVTEIVKGLDFKVFQTVISNGGVVKGINVKNSAHFSRKEIDQLGEFVSLYKAKGLAWLAFVGNEVKGSLAKFMKETELTLIKEKMDVNEGDLLLFVADQRKIVYDALGNLRVKLAKELNLIDQNRLAFLWVTEFPLLAYDEEEKRYVAEHHPFTMPMVEDIHLLDTNPLQVRAQAYDMVLNGYELGGGSMRIYKKEIQEKMFNLLGFTPEEAKAQFGFLLDAFEYGTPPHGGIAFGLDRLVMILAGKQTLRDVIAFPKTSSASCLLTSAPSVVNPKQLQELKIDLIDKR